MDVGALARHCSPETLEQFDLLLATSPSPAQGLHYAAAFSERQPAVLGNLAKNAASLRYLVGVFTYSRFLSESLLEHPGWSAQLLDADDLNRVVSSEDLRRRLLRTLPPGVPDAVYFARFRRRQLLRIVVRDVFGLGTVPQITSELTTLAGVIVDIAYQRIYESLVRQHGRPLGTDGAEAHFSVLALGKMGAEELNYSSDIDLMFLYSENGQTDGAEPISNQEFFTRAANQLTKLLSSFTPEGMCYRVDLRLRPDGQQGEICISLDGAKHYYGSRARDWELQMLIKARVAAGHRATGQALLAFTAPKTYSTTLDFSAIEQLSLTRERINESIETRAANRAAGRSGLRTRRSRPSRLPPQDPPGREGIDVKLHRGGIRDIEFLVQCLQRLQGGAEPWLQHRATLQALARLQDKGILSDTDYGRLAAAYQFLRNLEHRLQFDEDRQTHTLPTEPGELAILGRKMPGLTDPDALASELERHFEQVSAIYDRVIHMPATATEGLQTATLLTTLQMSAPHLATAVRGAELTRGAARFEHFLERLASEHPQDLEQLDRDAELTSATLDLFEHSPFFSEELVRRPANVMELMQPADPVVEEIAQASDQTALRRAYRRGLLRIEAGGLFRSEPLFEALDTHSSLAESVIRTVYRFILEEDGNQQDVNTAPLWVISLGRLGMREFDLGSDADLAFVLADEAARDTESLAHWTRIAERMIAMITAYTGSGNLFAVDTRLRPYGGAGALVMGAGRMLEYFKHDAEAWEGITYLKARVVAGDPEAAETFLMDLQQTYWNRYGAAGSSRGELRKMRLRLEEETGKARPLKAGSGGYYDIDFVLLFLRLKNAGIYYRALNTPARIKALEAIGALNAQNASFLTDAATFYRALDHAIRLISGKAEGHLPKSSSQRDNLESILPRWTPIPLHELKQVQLATRALFTRIFG